MEITYQIGRAQQPEKDDPMFKRMSEALQKMRVLGDEYPDTVFALWNITDVDTVYIVYLLFQGDLYHKT